MTRWPERDRRRKELILEIIKEQGPITSLEILKQIHCDDGEFHDILKEFVRKGKIKMVRVGRKFAYVLCGE